MTTTNHRPRPAHTRAVHRVPFLRVLFGGMFALGAGIHVYLASVAPHVYATFADAALLTFVRSAWSTVVGTHATLPMLALAAFELAAGLLVLFGRRRHRLVGTALMIAFHLALMLFGWGFWLWCVPALVLLGVLFDGIRTQETGKAA
ncbi:MAG: hypothetical protein GEV10_14435 [Streptosporangiales bacterium]|nr:hypothetical protein [Streptosporangiales bacterium]